MGRQVSVAERLSRAVLDFVFPPRCVVCGSGGSFLCTVCASGLPKAEPPRCPRCWSPGSDAYLCPECQAGPPAFDGLRAAFLYQGVVRDLVHALKYRGTTALAGPMASLLADVVHRDVLAADVLVPVPLAGVRRRTRGFNQAESLARALGRELGLPVRPGALRRRRQTTPQARTADAEQRRRNVAGAFACREGPVAGQRVLLVDDVTTTGATLAACAGPLKAGGARSVWAITFARED